LYAHFKQRPPKAVAQHLYIFCLLDSSNHTKGYQPPHMFFPQSRLLAHATPNANTIVWLIVELFAKMTATEGCDIPHLSIF
jgi:hypothetical protein